VPSILRNSSRYRRDQRQLEEEEEIWFNEEDDFADVAANKVTAELDSSLGNFLKKSYLSIDMSHTSRSVQKQTLAS